MFPPSRLKWLYVDFNSYFASVEQQLNPALRGKPVVVVPVDSDSTCAIAASYEAKAYGIRTGTPIWEAKQNCPGLICVLARHDAYVDYHHRAIAEINRHVPVTAVCSIDEMAARLMRNEAQPEAARRIALAIKAGLAERLGPLVRCSIGIAANRYLAKVATDIEKPDGLTILMPEEVEIRIKTLKLRDLPGIGCNMERQLNRVGIYTMSDLLALDRRDMRRVWRNIWGERMWYYLRGIDLPEQPTQRRSIGHSHVLAPALRPAHIAIDVARRLTMKAASRLRRMGYHATVFGFSARLEDGRRVHADRKCRPAQDSMTFLSIMMGLWDHLLPQSPGPVVKKVSVVLYGLTAEADRQLDIFEEAENYPHATPFSRSAGKWNDISAAIDKINTRFGKDSALIGMLPVSGRSFSGTKIAFTRIPDVAEFHE